MRRANNRRETFRLSLRQKLCYSYFCLRCEYTIPPPPPLPADKWGRKLDTISLEYIARDNCLIRFKTNSKSSPFFPSSIFSSTYIYSIRFCRKIVSTATLSPSFVLEMHSFSLFLEQERRERKKKKKTPFHNSIRASEP